MRAETQKARIFGKIIFRRSHEVGEIAAAAARDRNLQAEARITLEQRHPPPALSGSKCAHHPGAAAADHDYLVTLQSGFFPAGAWFFQFPEKPVVVRDMLFQTIVPGLWRLLCQPFKGRQERILRRLIFLSYSDQV